MKKPGIVLFLALFVYAAPVPTPAPVLNPGIVFEVETTDHKQSPPRVGEMEILVEGPNLAIPVTAGSGSGGKMIFRGDKGKNGEVVIVNDDRKEYYVMNDKTMEAMAGQLGAVAGAVAEALKNLPKEQREAIEKMQKRGGAGMAGMGAGAMKPRAKPEIKNTGVHGDKGGYPCVKYEVVQEGKVIREIWTTDWDNIDGGDEAAEAFKALGAFFEAFWKAMPSMPGGDPFGGQNPFEEMNFEKGFPVVVTVFGEDGNIEDESWLKRTRRQRIDPAEFEPPSGYKRMSLGPN